MSFIKESIKNLLPYGFLKFYWKKRRIQHNSQGIYFNTFQNMSIAIRDSLKYIPSDIDLVVGIPRSGMIPAYMIALFLNKQCCSFSELKYNILPEHGERKIEKNNWPPKKILIVDDSVYSGNALDKVKSEVDSLCLNRNFLYYAVFVTNNSKGYVDYYAKVVQPPRIFQWNYMNHSILSRSCVDFDGVLCVDPTDAQNDDGEAYKVFLHTAKPLFIPSVKIHAIVTSRLEKYRSDTEEWLRQHNVKYDSLIMLNLETARERQQKNCHASFKANIYKNDNEAILFIESNNSQAKNIATLSGKPCLCVETDMLYE